MRIIGWMERQAISSMKCLVPIAAGIYMLVITPAAMQASPNFYLPDAKLPAPKNKVEEPMKSPAPSPTPKATTPVKAAAPQAKTGQKTVAPATTEKLVVRKNISDRPFNPPLDPFGLARAFKHRWDFSSFMISAEEELKFRLEAARNRTLRLARAFSSLSEEVEIRHRNLSSAALAAYLLSRDQYTWNPLQGRNLTEAQMLAVKSTMKQDIAAMRSALNDYEVLRNSLNESAEDVALLEKRGLAAVASSDPATFSRPTVPTAELMAQRTESVLQERLVSIEALKATLAAENLSNTGDRRRSIASFAPPPPQGTSGRSVTSLPELPSADVMKAQPRGESLKAPERTALLVKTSINAPVHAVRSGVVMYAGPFRGYGSMVIIEHEKGVFTIYSHMETVQVREREPVTAGALLGRAGIPPELGGPGIHFQVRHGKNAIKPDDWLGVNQAEKLLTKN